MGVTEEVGVCVGVIDAVAPKESEGVGVEDGVGVILFELDAVVPKETDAVGVLLGVGVPLIDGVVEGAADRLNPLAVRTHGVPPFGFDALMEGT